MGWTYTQRLLSEVPGLKLVFDTGNPGFSDDFSVQPGPDGKRPKQSSWEFYRHIRDHVAYIHIKDGIIGPDGKHVFTYPGEGSGDIPQILTDLIKREYDGGISIEPHLAVVFHDPAQPSAGDNRRSSYIEYGKRLQKMVETIQAKSV
jgi:hypothetical protein